MIGAFNQQFSMPQCRKHNQTLEAVCTNEFCSQKWRLLCRTCVRDSHAVHAEETVAISWFVKSLQSRVEQANSENRSLQESLGKLFLQNSWHITKLKEKIQFYTDSQNTMQNAFSIIKEQGNAKIKRAESQLSDFIKCVSFVGNGEDEINARISSLKNCTASLGDLKFAELQRIQDQCRGVQSNFHHINTFLDSAIADSNATQNTFENTSISTQDMIRIKMRNQEDKNIARISDIFPTIKGKAKKRDIINFVNWDPQARELKYQKDNKDKSGEHFYVSFSLSLIGIDALQEKDFTEEFILQLVDRIRVEAPHIHERKNFERRKMESLGKKRKYCRFHPKIDLDLIDLSKKVKTDQPTALISSPSIAQQLLQNNQDRFSVSSSTPLNLQSQFNVATSQSFPTIGSSTMNFPSTIQPITPQNDQLFGQQSIQPSMIPSNNATPTLQQQSSQNLQQQIQQIQTNLSLLQQQQQQPQQQIQQSTSFLNQTLMPMQTHSPMPISQSPETTSSTNFQQPQLISPFISQTSVQTPLTQQQSQQQQQQPQVNNNNNGIINPFAQTEFANSYLSLTPENKHLFMLLTQQPTIQQQVEPAIPPAQLPFKIEQH